jgi:alcohol dehydrogenase (NADP+)
MPETREMLDFCAHHKVAPMIETVRADQINEGFARLRRADVRYRFVIDAATL